MFMYIYIYIRVYVCMCERIYTHIYIRMYVCVCVYVYIHTHPSETSKRRMWMYIRVYVYIHTYTAAQARGGRRLAYRFLQHRARSVRMAHEREQWRVDGAKVAEEMVFAACA